MVLDKIYLDNRINEVLENKHNYLVLNIEKFQYSDDKDKFKNSIEVLDIINTISWANDFYKKANSDIRINTSILYKVIDASFTNKRFNDSKLIEYYETMILLENFIDAMLRFEHVENYTPYELEFVLFGFSYDEQAQLNEKQKEDFHEFYGNLYCDVRMQKMKVEDFIQQIKKKIVEVKE